MNPSQALLSEGNPSQVLLSEENPFQVLLSEGTLYTLDGKALAFPPKECGKGWTPCEEHYENMFLEGENYCTTYVIYGFVIQIRWSETSTSKEILIWNYLETGIFTPIPTCTDPYGFVWVAEMWEVATEQPHNSDTKPLNEPDEDPDQDEVIEALKELNSTSEAEFEAVFAAEAAAEVAAASWKRTEEKDVRAYRAAHEVKCAAEREFQMAKVEGKTKSAIAELCAIFVAAEKDYLEVKERVYPSK